MLFESINIESTSTYCHSSYTQNMSEPEERPSAGKGEPSAEEKGTSGNDGYIR